jgi:hypothetical protein
MLRKNFLVVVFLFVLTPTAFSASTMVSSVDLTGTASTTDIVIQGNYAYISSKPNTGTNPEFQIVDISNLATPLKLGSYDTGGSSIEKIYVEGNRAYLATNSSQEELIILDITNKSAPVKVGSFNAPGSYAGSAVTSVGYKNVYFVRKQGAGEELYVLDTTNPANIVTLGTYEVNDNVNDIVVNRDFAYLATATPTREVCVLKITNPAQISIVGSYDIPGTNEAKALDFSVDKLYVVSRGSYSKDFFVFNVGSTGALSLVGTSYTGGNPLDVYIYGQQAYVTTSIPAQGLVLVNVSNPAAPIISGSFDTQTDANAVWVRRALAYVVTNVNTKEVQVISFSNNIEPVITDINGDSIRTISCTGDSNTEGVPGITPWPAFLQGLITGYYQLPNVQIINRAKGFSTAVPIPDSDFSDSIKQFNIATANDFPDAIMMAFGTNDIAFTITSAVNNNTTLSSANFNAILDTYRSLITMGKALNLKLYFAYVPAPYDQTITADYRNNYTLLVNSRMRYELPREYLLDFYYTLKIPEDYYGDTLHMNNSGQFKRAVEASSKIVQP